MNNNIINNNNDEFNLINQTNQPNTIFVGGINWRADENALKNYFNSKFGPVVDCKIIMDKTTQKSKGYGFITFQNQETVNLVRSSPNLLFMGKNMNIGDAVRKGNINKIFPYSPNIIYPDRSLEDSDDEHQFSLTQSSPLLLSEQSTPILSSNFNLGHHHHHHSNQQHQNGNNLNTIYINGSNINGGHIDQSILPIQQHQSTPPQQHYYYSKQHYNGNVGINNNGNNQPVVGSYGYLFYDASSGSTYQIPFSYFQPPPQQPQPPPPQPTGNTPGQTQPNPLNSNTNANGSVPLINSNSNNSSSNGSINPNISPPHYNYHSPTHYVYQTYHYHPLLDQQKIHLQQNQNHHHQPQPNTKSNVK